MRISSILPLVFLLGVTSSHAQSGQALDTPAPDRSYQLLSEDEDWSFLRDPALRQDFWDPMEVLQTGARRRVCAPVRLSGSDGLQPEG
jgi:hypothetical protein